MRHTPLDEQLDAYAENCERFDMAVQVEREALRDKYYCPEHRYNPPANSGFALCPYCEIQHLDSEAKKNSSQGLVE